MTWLHAVLVAIGLGVALLGPMVEGRSQAAPAATDKSLLVAEPPDISNLVGDWQRLLVTGTVRVAFANRGAADATAFDWQLYLDRDDQTGFDDSVDLKLAGGRLAGLASGVREELRIALPANTQLAFREEPLWLHLDPGAETDQRDRRDDIAHSGLRCRPAPGALDLHEEWAWTGPPDEPGCGQVMQTPVVGDLDGDGIPEIVFSSFCGDEFDSGGQLRAIRGDGGGVLWSIEDPSLATSATTNAVIGDLDGDDRPEVLAAGADGQSVLAFEADGQWRWRMPIPEPTLGGGGLALADMDGVAPPEVLAGGGLLDAEGRSLWHIAVGAGLGRGGPRFGRKSSLLPVASDLNGDGRQELLAGSTLFDHLGRELWHRPHLPGGFTAVADFDADGEPEIVLVGEQHLWLLKADGSKRWGPVALPPAQDPSKFVSGGPPTVADFDGDGQPEIGVSASTGVAMIDADGTMMWTRPIQDLSGITGASAFDFEADGASELVFADELALRIYDGASGEERARVMNPNATQTELPVVVDVDGDGAAEIVKAAANFRYAGSAGIHVYGSASGRWPATRAVWNQQPYSIDNVSDVGGIPEHPARGWLGHNSFRSNPADPRLGGLPDLTAGRLEARALGGDRFEIRARIGNAGAISVPAGAAIAFYREDVSGAEVLVGRNRLAASLEPGEWVDLALAIRSSGPAERIIVSADDEGTTGGRIEECDESNNRHERVLRVVPEPPDEATPTLTIGDCVCELVRQRVPPALISLALAEPQRFAGWGLPLDPNKPPGPSNPPRACLQLAHPSLDFHPLYNRPLWQVGCP